MADQRTPHGDEAELFRTYNATLLRDVARSVTLADRGVVEDACAFAWMQFMQHQPDRDRNWHGWMFGAAQREAWRLESQAHEDRPLRTSEDERKTDYGEAIDPRDYQAIRLDVDEALSIVHEIPPRLQRIALLRALGLKYDEISEITGDSKARVGVLVSRANLEIYEIIAERARHERSSSPRAERLWQLEREQPEWLVDELGQPPKLARHNTESLSTRRRAWRRAALALDDLREAVGPERFGEALASPPREPGLRRLHETARRTLDELERGHEQTPRRHIGD
jgi:DNA-directed RNA polymerase specialized sigma24 family protein